VLQARDTGVSEFLCKPISAKALYDRIYSIVMHPRPFIRTKSYFGPDRRRAENPAYSGAERRISDPKEFIVTEDGSGPDLWELAEEDEDAA
jgi:hypothetical protein